MPSYARWYRKFYHGGYEAIRGRNMLHLLAQAEERQWWTPGQLREWQREHLLRILTSAYNRSDFYHQRMEQAGAVPEAKSDPFILLKQLPPLTRTDVQRNFQQLVAKGHGHPLLVKGTGGSTGQPVRVGYDDPVYRFRMALAQRAYAWAGCEDGVRTAYLWGGAIASVSAVARWKLAFDNALARRMIINTFGQGTQDFPAWEQRIRAANPIGLITYTTPGYELARFMLAKRSRPFGTAAIITAAEAVYPHQRRAMEMAFGGRVFESYGSREVTSIAMECSAHQGLHINADGLLVEIQRDGTDAEPGTTGEVWLTDLMNEAFPLIRYALGDLAVPSNRTCACGRGLPLIERIDGRVLDALRDRRGRMIPGEFFPHMMGGVSGIDSYQVVQDRDDRVVITLVPGPGLTDETVAFIRQASLRRLGEGMLVEIKMADSIPAEPSGKLRVTKCVVERGEQRE